VTREAPLPGNVLQLVVELNTYDGNSGRYNTEDPELAQVTTSMVAGTENGPVEERMHRPVLDLDLPARLVPSSTPGHFHLYLDVQVPHSTYMTLLLALSAAGIIERGYCDASRERGYTAVRLPWVRKDDPQLDPAVPMALQRDLEPEDGTDLLGRLLRDVP
jgi:hypothetical protein